MYVLNNGVGCVFLELCALLCGVEMSGCILIKCSDSGFNIFCVLANEMWMYYIVSRKLFKNLEFIQFLFSELILGYKSYRYRYIK